MSYPRPDLLDEIARLRSRVEELEAENAHLRGDFTLPADDVLKEKLGLYPWLYRPFKLLATHEFVSKDALRGEIEWDETNNKLPVAIIHRLRRALRPYHITIHNVWGEGYYIDAKDRRRLKKILNEKESQSDQNR